ncbi:MAG: hypothetical protein E7547_07610 [Ruminococcaceae bacterium]|nr:hypothetical protein [Oscillospiraceae bacterium]
MKKLLTVKHIQLKNLTTEHKLQASSIMKVTNSKFLKLKTSNTSQFSIHILTT